MSYWQRKAAPWVSFSVLFGGLVSALILFFLVKVERDVQGFNNYEDQVVWEVSS